VPVSGSRAQTALLATCRVAASPASSEQAESRVTRRGRHGCQMSRPATGVSCGLNISLSLSTSTAPGCHGFGIAGEPPLAALPAGDLRRVLAELLHPVEAFLARIGIVARPAASGCALPQLAGRLGIDLFLM
jgi:hypothetical protein